MATGSQKNIIILGGSYGGVSIAHSLLKHAIPKLPDSDSYQVVLISAASQVMCRPACPRALISDAMFAQDKLFVGIPGLFEQYPQVNFRFVHGRATKLDTANRTVSVDLPTGSSETFSFHALVIATGASTYSPLLGLNQDENALRADWKTFREALPTAKTIVIAGGGPAGVETAGELGEYLNGRPGWFSSKPASPIASITVVTSDSKILPGLRPSIAQQAETYLGQVGVTVTKNTRVTSVSPDNAGAERDLLTAKTTVSLSNGSTLDADLYIPAYGTRPNTSFIDKALLQGDGRVETNPSTLRVDRAGPRVYAIGDASSYARPAIHLMLDAVPVLAANIKRDLLSAAGQQLQGEDRMFKEDTRETQMVPIGTAKGVGSAMGWSLPSFLVWAIKGRDYWLWTTGGLWSGSQWAKES